MDWNQDAQQATNQHQCTPPEAASISTVADVLPQPTTSPTQLGPPRLTIMQGDNNPIIPRDLLRPGTLVSFFAWLLKLRLPIEEDKRVIFDYSRITGVYISIDDLNGFYALKGTDVP